MNLCYLNQRLITGRYNITLNPSVAIKGDMPQ